jgi:hypothetical protein
VPIHVEENGYPTGPGRSYDRQAQSLETQVRAFHDFRGTYNVSDYRWFNLRDGDTSSPMLFQHFGLLEDDYDPKPAFGVYRRLVSQLARRACDVALGRWMQGAQRGHQGPAYTRARVGGVTVGVVLAPSPTPGAAVRAGVLAAELEQRADQAAVARGHAEQRAAARRRRQPVEDRLDLVGGRVSGGHLGPAREREPRGGPVAQVTGPGMEVSLPRLASVLHRQRHSEVAAELAAVALVTVCANPQPIVDVEGGHALLACERNRDVEQADRVPPPGEHDHQRAPGRQQPARAHGLEHSLRDVDHDPSLRMGAAARRRALTRPARPRTAPWPG